MAQSIVTEEASSAWSNLLAIVTGVTLSERRRVKAVLDADTVPGAEIRQPGQTLRTNCAFPNNIFRLRPALTSRR